MTDDQNVEVIDGDSLFIRATIYDTDQDPPQLLSLVGASMEWVVRRLMPPKSPIIQLNEASTEVTITNPGVIEFDLPASRMKSKVGKYRHQCRVTLPSGRIGTVFQGDFQILSSLL